MFLKFIASQENLFQLKARMDGAMGGRAAEELIFGKDKITGRNLLDVTQFLTVTSAPIGAAKVEN